MLRLRTAIPVLLPWLDILAMLSWGSLMLKYYATGQLRLLIHPNYIPLTLAAGFVLLMMGFLRLLRLLRQWRQSMIAQALPHFTLLPPGLGMGLLTGVAIAGLLIPPTVLASDTALQRGISDTLPVTQTQVQSFYNPTPPEERSLIEWVRTLNAYPEPDAYTDQAVDVTGFVVHPPELPEDYVLVSRFVITCCAVDAYPVGLPVKVSDRDDYPADSWLRVQGVMATETFESRRQLIIDPQDLETIPTPDDPYEF
ncbi:MAG: TIGR03943 family putative permease subunit [Spirulinaceae cyanobacterium]